MERTRRRRFLLAAGALAASPFVRAQPPSRVPVLRLLYPNPHVTTDGDFRVAVVKIMKSLGWTAGKDLKIEYYSGDGREERLPALAERVVEGEVNVIWVGGPEAALAAAHATKSVPIAFYGVAYPVEQGLVDSLGKPGRNVTGITTFAGSEGIKNLENLREVAPALRRLARIRVETAARDIHGREIVIRDTAVDAAAQGMGFQMRKFPVSAPEDLDGAFAAIAEWRPEGLMCDFTAMTFRERLRIIDFANRHRLPSLFGAFPYVRDGGLMSYGASRRWMAVHSFTFVDRILRGASPADLPVELPTRFELLINLRTAKALGLSVPQSLLLRADRVFE
jgi:putative ABC transport system substrate-binding protein